MDDILLTCFIILLLLAFVYYTSMTILKFSRMIARIGYARQIHELEAKAKFINAPENPLQSIALHAESKGYFSIIPIVLNKQTATSEYEVKLVRWGIATLRHPYPQYEKSRLAAVSRIVEVAGEFDVCFEETLKCINILTRLNKQDVINPLSNIWFTRFTSDGRVSNDATLLDYMRSALTPAGMEAIDLIYALRQELEKPAKEYNHGQIAKFMEGLLNLGIHPVIQGNRVGFTPYLQGPKQPIVLYAVIDYHHED